MNTYTFNLANGKNIQFKSEETNPTRFLKVLLQRGEELDLEASLDAQVIGFTCEFWFNEEDLLKE